MKLTIKNQAVFLFFGDIVVLVASLWLTLFLRYLAFPSRELFLAHLAPFIILFVVWIIVYFIAGLYEKHTLVLKSRLPSVIFNSQLINIAIAVAFFYLTPYFLITPKTNLFIYLIISFPLILTWRIAGQNIFTLGRKQRALLIGSGEEMKELLEEVNRNPRYGLTFVSSVDVDEIDGVDFRDEILQRVYSEDILVIVIDLQNEKVVPILPHLYNLIFSKIRFVDMHRVYEDIFSRVPLSLLRYSWFLENISTAPKVAYDILKRLMDIVISLPLWLVSLVLYPFVWLAVIFDDRGGIFFRQARVGRNNQPLTLLKFRTMSRQGSVNYSNDSVARVTKVGAFLRKTRIDELPQLWNVLAGDLSLIGPRPEIPELVKSYETQVPFYNVRHLIKPGLSGWAQIYHENHPHHGVSVPETKNKLSYDLYYIKNRSFMLDLKIALKTLKILLSRTGR